jgi:hypothetical protein
MKNKVNARLCGTLSEYINDRQQQQDHERDAGEGGFEQRDER